MSACELDRASGVMAVLVGGLIVRGCRRVCLCQHERVAACVHVCVCECMRERERERERERDEKPECACERVLA